MDLTDLTVLMREEAGADHGSRVVSAAKGEGGGGRPAGRGYSIPGDCPAPVFSRPARANAAYGPTMTGIPVIQLRLLGICALKITKP